MMGRDHALSGALVFAGLAPMLHVTDAHLAAGVALTIINSRAVLEALFGYQTSFVRTPKYAIGGAQKVHLENTKYRRRSGWLPYAELAVGT